MGLDSRVRRYSNLGGRRSQRHSVEFLLSNVADKLVFPKLKLDELKAPLDEHKKVLALEVKKSQRLMSNKSKRLELDKRVEKVRERKK